MNPKAQVIKSVPFVPDSRLEACASALLGRYERTIEPITAPPVPVEKVADLLLDLVFDWQPIRDTDEEPILAYIDPQSQRICLNQSRRPHFNTYFGTYEFTVAHELGHHDLHLGDGGLEQVEFDFGQGMSNKQVFVCRGTETSRRELQADRYASYLLMPAQLLVPAIEDMPLSWPALYKLRDAFHVSITALKIRLENLGCLYVDENGDIHRSPEEAAGQMCFL